MNIYQVVLPGSKAQLRSHDHCPAAPDWSNSTSSTPGALGGWGAGLPTLTATPASALGILLCVVCFSKEQACPVSSALPTSACGMGLTPNTPVLWKPNQQALGVVRRAPLTPTVGVAMVTQVSTCTSPDRPCQALSGQPGRSGPIRLHSAPRMVTDTAAHAPGTWVVSTAHLQPVLMGASSPLWAAARSTQQ